MMLTRRARERRQSEPGDSPAPARGPERTLANQLRRAYARRLGRLRRRPVFALSAVHLLGHCAFAGAVAAAEIVAWRRSPILGAIMYLPAIVLIGTRLRALGNMIHEASHAALARSSTGNRLLGELLSAIDLSSFSSYVEQHRSHHMYVGERVLDRDVENLRRLGFADPSGTFLRRHLLFPLRLGHLWRYLRPRPFTRADGAPVVMFRLCVYAGMASVVWIAGWWWLALYAVPYCTTYQMLRYWSDASDHAGLIDEPDEFLRARNHMFRSTLLNWLVYPRHDEYHLVHHVFPSVPVRHQPRVHELLLQDPVYAARRHSVRAMIWPARPEPGQPIPVPAWPAEDRASVSR